MLTNEEIKDTYNKISEFNKLTNRLRRYLRKLEEESLLIAKEKGLELITIDESLEYPIIKGENQIFIYNFRDELKTDELIALSRDKFPSLYRRYNKYYKKRRKIDLELNKLTDILDKKRLDIAV
ncbi:MAG TPA: hypothetical protein VJH65_03460 [Candidatus Nanoarchaeia archaeon]|nr:hypothetical protein [Candidatus Nanoarchaeia archaeon]